MFYWLVLLAVIPLISLLESNRTIPQDCADPNEIFSAYGGPCEPTCQNPECKRTDNCKAACICSNGYVRDRLSGNCIKKEHCCLNQYEVYNDYGSACESTCESPMPRPCREEYIAGCFCSNGTIRNTATGECVNISNCTCKSENEEFSECGPSCDPCSTKPVMCRRMCLPGCFCKDGMIRDDTTGKCKNCPCPTKDEVFSTCGTLCPKTCSKPEPGICSEMCVKGCFCKDKNKVRDENTGKCVNIEQCTCEDENEEYKTCASACQPNCTHPETPIACTKQCTFGCFCKNGTIRNTETGKCVHPKDCFCNLEARCEKNEVFRSGPAVEKSCASPNVEKEVDHNNNCYCKRGYFRNEKTGECVRLNGCCNSKDHKVFNMCVSVGGVCENTCSSPNKTQICKAPCGPGCKCKEGFLLDDNTRKCIPRGLCPTEAADTKESSSSDSNDCTCPEDEECNHCKNENEEFQTCGSACPPTCTNPKPYRACTMQCVIGCFCTNGTVRDEKTGRCVSLQDC